MFGLISAGLGVLSGVKSLFSKSPKTPKVDIRDNIYDQAGGARAAASRYGFNPLTMLGASGAVAGVAQGGGGSAGYVPPLASVSAIAEGLKGIDDITSGDQARRRAADQAELELARIQIDRAKAGILDDGSRTARAAHSISSSESTLGRRAATMAPVRGDPAALGKAGKFGYEGGSPVAPGREQEVMPLPNSPGVFEMQNRATLGKPITIPGDGEPWGIDELATAAIFGLPQVAGGAANEYFMGGKSVKDHRDDAREQAAKDRDDTERMARIRAEQAENPHNPHRAPSTPYRNPRNFTYRKFGS